VNPKNNIVHLLGFLEAAPRNRIYCGLGGLFERAIYTPRSMSLTITGASL
jgi:hypothetical protein